VLQSASCGPWFWAGAGSWLWWDFCPCGPYDHCAHSSWILFATGLCLSWMFITLFLMESCVRRFTSSLL
jgi:hypothetical protein